MIRSPPAITKLLNSASDADQKQGYDAFLGRTHWYDSPTPEGLKMFACLQLNIRAHHVIASNVKFIQPGLLWASQDGLEAEKLNMVEAAYNYMKTINQSFPPIIVWNFFDSQSMRLIVHDGHHRAYFAHRYNVKLQAVVLEPLGNYEIVEDKFRYAFQIRKRVVDLPVLRNVRTIDQR